MTFYNLNLNEFASEPLISSSILSIWSKVKTLKLKLFRTECRKNKVHTGDKCNKNKLVRKKNHQRQPTKSIVL